MNATSQNPLLPVSWPPPFGDILPEHVEPAITRLLKDAERSFERVEASVAPTWAAAVDAVDACGRDLDDAWRVISHLNGVQNSDALRQAYDAVLPGLVQFGLRVGQSKPVYDALCALRDAPDALSGPQRRLVDARILDMTLAGVGLRSDLRERFNSLATELSDLSTRFSNNVLDATNQWEWVVTSRDELVGLSHDDLALLSASYTRAHGESSSADAGPWRVTLDYPSVRAVLDNCETRGLRERVYRAFVTRASEGDTDNAANVRAILRIRREQAKLLGYDTFAAMAMQRKMATVDSALQLLQDLRAASWAPAERDMERLTAFAAELGQDESLAPWDVRFYREKLRERSFAFSSDELRAYFPFQRVLDGLFSLVQRLFGVEVVAADGAVPVWDPSVRYFELHRDGAPFAAFYLDPFARPENKRGGAWMATAHPRRVREGAVQMPVAYLTCNGTPPVDGAPSTMSFSEVETLFHEFGHGLQHMLTTVDVEQLAGISGVEWDAVELPSQFMENWCYHRATVAGMTAHIETGEPLPDSLFDKLVAAKTFFAGTDFLRQITFGLLDLALHTTHDPDVDDAVELQHRIAASTSHIPLLPEDRFVLSFAHIFAGGYAAGYYSYKWAEVLSADAFEAFEEAGLDDPEACARVGAAFRDTVLALGGSVAPADVYTAFRGRPASPNALIRHNDLEVA